MKISIRRQLLLSTIATSALFGAAPVWAQAAPAAAQQDQQAPATQDAEVSKEDDVVVTGTLIRNPNLSSANPVTVLGEAEIQLRQSNTAEDLLRQVPGVVPSIGSAVNNGNGGGSFADLRGLGTNRNLVLIDGVRLAPAGLGGVFDLNNIPVALVQRVESLTGGATTTYGADAISGVINFVTKKDFEGLDLTVSEQVNGQGDGNYYRADLTLGASSSDGRGNAVFSVGYQESKPVFQGDRDFSINNIDSNSGAAGGSGTTVPTRLVGLRGGSRQINPDTGNFAPTAAFNAFNFNPFNIFQTPFRRYNLYGAAHYELDDHLKVYTRGIFSKNTVQTIIAPSGAFAVPIRLPLSNSFLPAPARNSICALYAGDGIDHNPNAAGVQAIDVAGCAAFAAATGPNDPNYREINVNLSRRAVEAGPRTSTFTTTFFDYRLGLGGDIGSHVNWDIWGSYGQSENSSLTGGYLLNSRIAQSVLTQGTGASATCQNPANGCVPANFFGAAGTITPAQVAFLVGDSIVTTNTALTQARATISGDVGFHVPFANDAISFAVAGEYRKYDARIFSDTLASSGDLGGAGGAQPNVNGSYDVYEGFGEISIPLVQDRPFFKDLTVNGGIRYSAYTVNAANTPKYNPTTWSFRGTWDVFSKLRVRGSYSRSARAANIGELFSPQTTGLTNLSATADLCANLLDNGTRIPGRATPTGALRDVCILQGAPAGLIGQIPVPVAGQANSTTGGNPNLQPEISNSFTAGLVVTNPIPGLTLTVDYFNIALRGAITSPTPGDVIAACFNNVSVANPFCGRNFIGRDTVTGGLSGDTNTVPGLFGALSNLGRIATDGIDLQTNYRHDLGFGKLNLDFLGTWTNKNTFQATPTSINRNCVSFYSVNCGSIQPAFQFSQRSTFSVDKIDLSLLWRYLSPVDYERIEAAANGALFRGPVPSLGGRNLNFNHIGAYHYFDFSARFATTEKLTFTLSVQNLFDRAPPIVGSTAGTTAFNSGNTYPSTYDALGRRFAFTARLRY